MTVGKVESDTVDRTDIIGRSWLEKTCSTERVVKKEPTFYLPCPGGRREPQPDRCGWIWKRLWPRRATGLAGVCRSRPGSHLLRNTHKHTKDDGWWWKHKHGNFINAVTLWCRRLYDAQRAVVGRKDKSRRRKTLQDTKMNWALVSAVSISLFCFVFFLFYWFPFCCLDASLFLFSQLAADAAALHYQINGVMTAVE